MQKKLLIVTKLVLVLTKLFNISVNDFDRNKSTPCNRVIVVTELVVSGTQCVYLYVCFFVGS